MNLNYSKIIIFLFVIFWFSSCKKNQTLLHDFNNSLWLVGDTVIFSVNVDLQDVNKPKHVSIFFRNNLNYPYRNIFLLTEIHDSLSMVRKDTLQYLLSDKYGRWLGRGLGKTRDNYLIFDNKMIFSKPGNYMFFIRHGMRSETLNGAMKIGVRIE